MGAQLSWRPCQRTSTACCVLPAENLPVEVPFDPMRPAGGLGSRLQEEQPLPALRH